MLLVWKMLNKLWNVMYVFKISMQGMEDGPLEEEIDRREVFSEEPSIIYTAQCLYPRTGWSTVYRYDTEVWFHFPSKSPILPCLSRRRCSLASFNLKPAFYLLTSSRPLPPGEAACRAWWRACLRDNKSPSGSGRQRAVTFRLGLPSRLKPRVSDRVNLNTHS